MINKYIDRHSRVEGTDGLSLSQSRRKLRSILHSFCAAFQRNTHRGRRPHANRATLTDQQRSRSSGSSLQICPTMLVVCPWIVTHPNCTHPTALFIVSTANSSQVVQPSCQSACFWLRKACFIPTVNSRETVDVFGFTVVYCRTLQVLPDQNLIRFLSPLRTTRPHPPPANCCVSSPPSNIQGLERQDLKHPARTGRAGRKASWVGLDTELSCTPRRYYTARLTDARKAQTLPYVHTWTRENRPYWKYHRGQGFIISVRGGRHFWKIDTYCRFKYSLAISCWKPLKLHLPICPSSVNHAFQIRSPSTLSFLLSPLLPLSLPLPLPNSMWSGMWKCDVMSPLPCAKTSL